MNVCHHQNHQSQYLVLPVAERIKRTSIVNQTPPQQSIKKEIPSKILMGGTTQGHIKMRRESFDGTTSANNSTKTATNGKVNASTKK